MNISRHAYAIAAILAVLTAASVSSTHSKTLAKTSPLQVFVMNGTGNPVPTAAQGTTQIAGTVGLSNGASVAVNNAANNPIPVHDASNGGKAPFDAAITLSYGPGDDFLFATLYTVPTGKMLVVTGETVQAVFPVGQKLLGADISGPTFGQYLNFEDRGDDGVHEFINGGTSAGIYLGAGETATATATRNSTSGSGFCFIAIHGYLVDE